jgi:hypothetical protein
MDIFVIVHLAALPDGGHQHPIFAGRRSFVEATFAIRQTPRQEFKR